MDIFIISFLITVMLVVFYFVSIKAEKERKTKSRIDSHIQMRAPKKAENENEKKELKTNLNYWFKNLTLKLRQYYKNSLPTQQEDQVQKKLLQAGNPFRMTVADYYIIK